MHAAERVVDLVGGQSTSACDAAVAGLHAAQPSGQRAYGKAADATSQGIDGCMKWGHDLVYLGVTTHELMRSTAEPNPSRVSIPPAHPDYALFKQSHAAAYRVDAQHGRMPDSCSSNLAESLVVAARATSLSRVDLVVQSDDGTRAFAAESALPPPTKQIAESGPIIQAVNTMLARSSEAWSQVM